MKMKKVVGLLIVVMAWFMFGGCGSGSGTYKMVKAESSSGAYYTPEDLFGSTDVTITLQKDGTGEMKIAGRDAAASGYKDDTYMTFYDPYTGDTLSGVAEVKGRDLIWTVTYYDSYYMHDASVVMYFRKKKKKVCFMTIPAGSAMMRAYETGSVLEYDRNVMRADVNALRSWCRSAESTCHDAV